MYRVVIQYRGAAWLEVAVAGGGGNFALLPHTREVVAAQRLLAFTENRTERLGRTKAAPAKRTKSAFAQVSA